MGIIFGIERDRDRRTRESDRLRRLGDAVVTEAEERERQQEVDRFLRAIEAEKRRRRTRAPAGPIIPEETEISPPGIPEEARPTVISTAIRKGTFEGLTPDESQRVFGGERLDELDDPLRQGQFFLLTRAGQISRGEFGNEPKSVEESLTQAEAELGPLLQNIITPDQTGGIRGRFERGGVRALGALGAGVQAADEAVEQANAFLNRILDTPPEQQPTSEEVGIEPILELFEEGAKKSRPVVDIATDVLAAPLGAVESAGIPGVSPFAGHTADVIQSQIVEDIATEFINPVALLTVAPFAMVATRGLRGTALAAQITSNMLATGLEPGLVRGTLRGLSLLRLAAKGGRLPIKVTDAATARSAAATLREAGNVNAAEQMDNLARAFEGTAAIREGRALVSEPTGTVLGAASSLPTRADVGGAAVRPLTRAGPLGDVTAEEFRQGAIGADVALRGADVEPTGLIPSTVFSPSPQRGLSILAGGLPRRGEDAVDLLKRVLMEEHGGLPNAKTVIRRELNANASVSGRTEAAAELPTSFSRERRTVKASELETRPDLFQARDADPGSAVSDKRVKELLKGFDEAQFSPPHAIINPETGKFIVYRGHHRTEAWIRKFGKDSDIEIFVVQADINNPQHVKALMLEGDSSNFKTALPNFREKVRAVTRAEAVGLDDSEIATRLRLSQGEVGRLIDANRLGPATLDLIVQDASLGPYASELGRAVRAFGMSPEDGAAWLRRLSDGTKTERPTITAFKDTLDKFGKEFQKVPEEMFAGFATTEGGTRGGILAVIDENTKLRTALETQIRNVKRTRNDLTKLGKRPGVTAEQRKALKVSADLAKDVEADLRKQIAANEKDVAAAFKGAQAGRPADLIASAERGAPEPRTSEIVATEGTQAVPSQASVEAVLPSPTTLATTPPSRIDGPANTLRSVGVLEETIDASAPILARIETVEQGVEAAIRLRDRILTEFREIGGENFFGVRAKVPANATARERADGIARIQEKVNGRQPNQISDYLGARFIGEPEDLERIAEQLNQRYRLIQFKATKGSTNRPDMINLDVDVGGAVSVEAQFLTPEWAAIQEQVHDLYKVFRSTTAPQSEVEAALAKATKLIADVPAPGSVDVATAKLIMAAVQRGDTATAERLLAAARATRTRFEVSGDVLGGVAPGTTEGRVAAGLRDIAEGKGVGPDAERVRALAAEVEQGALDIGAGERTIDTLPLFSTTEELVPGARVGGISRANGKAVEGNVLTVGERTVSVRLDNGNVTSISREGLEVTGAGARAPEPLPIEAPSAAPSRPTPMDVTERHPGARSLAPEPEATVTGSGIETPSQKRLGQAMDLPDELASDATVRITEVAAGSGIEPPRKPPPVAGGRGPGGTEPTDPEGWLALWMSRDPSEPAGRSYMRRFLGFRSTEGRDILNAYRVLKRNVPKPLRGTERTSEKEAFILALHGEGDIAQLPAEYRGLFTRLKARAKAHETRLVNVDPSFEKRLVPDYWPRQFKQEGGLSWIARNTEPGAVAGEPARVAARGKGALTPGAVPGFKRGRKYTSLRQALDNGEDLKTWDVVDQWFLRELEGTEHIYTSILAEAAKRDRLVIPRSIAPPDYEQLPYRAFESKAFVTKEGTTGWSEPLVAEPDFAKWMKRLFGKDLDEGFNVIDAMAYAAGTTKRMKVAISFFQQIDLSFRTISQANGQAARAIGRGDIPGFFKSYRIVPAIPRAFLEFFVPPMRDVARRNRLKNPLMRMMSEEGLQLEGGQAIAKRTLNQALTPDEVLRFPIVGDLPIPESLAPLRLVQKRLNQVTEFVNGGLFDAVHPRLVEAVSLSIYDETARVFPKLPQREIARRAAETTNIVMSALPDWQSVMTPRVRQFARSVIFSPNEFESWFRVTTGAMAPGAKGAAFRTQWLGYMITSFMFAELLNFAFTGKPLGKSQLMPISTDFNGKVQFNSRFMRPKLTGDGPAGRVTNFTGPLGQELYLDILGQADTPFRWIFSPTFAIMTRLSAPYSTAIQLITEKRFFGKKDLNVTTEIGPGISVPSPEALGFGAEQLAAPISLLALLGEEKQRIGRTGAIIQAGGFNVSSERFNELGERAFFEETGRPKYSGAFGSDKTDEPPLTGPEVQKIVREHERLQTIQDAGDKAARDLASPFQRVEDAVDNAGLLVELGESIDAAPESLAASAKACLAGNPQACTAARELKSDFFTSRESVRTSERERLEIDDLDPPDVETRDQEILEQYYALERKDFDRNGFIDSQDTRIFLEGRAALAGQLSAGARDALRDPARFFTDPNTIEFQRQFQAASDNVDLYFAIPKYNGLSLADSEELDRLSDEVRFARILEADASGEIPDDDPFWKARLPFLSPTIRAFVEEHFIAKRRAGGVSIIGRGRTRRFLAVGTGAAEEPEPTLNPEREVFRILHQELFIFFPDIFKVGLGAAATGLLQPETLAASTLAP